MPVDPNDLSLPELHVAVMSRQYGQAVQPIGVLVILPGDSVDVVAEPHAIRLQTFLVTDQIRDADSARFAYTKELAEENRRLKAENEALNSRAMEYLTDINRLWAALEMYGRKRTEELEQLEPTEVEYLGDPLDLPPEDPFWDTPHGPSKKGSPPKDSR